MSAADDLRALSAAATPGPWDQAEHAPWMIDSPGPAVAACVHEPDAELIVWLVNHAAALADLIDGVGGLIEAMEPIDSTVLGTGACAACDYTTHLLAALEADR